MANSKIIIASVLISFLFLVAVLPYASNAKSLKSCGFDAIYQLGDSISDTGNFIQEKPSSVYARFPYGETFFNKPTGRCSNGRLMIDFIGKERIERFACYLCDVCTSLILSDGLNSPCPLQQVQQVFHFLMLT
jgi:hypothetical protein